MKILRHCREKVDSGYKESHKKIFFWPVWCFFASRLSRGRSATRDGAFGRVIGRIWSVRLSLCYINYKTIECIEINIKSCLTEKSDFISTMSDAAYVDSPRSRDYVPKIKFTREEDSMLLMAVQKYGTNDWQSVSACLPGRNIRQCRERWNNYVNPDLVARPWTKEEDRILEEKYHKYGPRWRMIVTYFKNRSVNNVKNRWLTKQRRIAKSQARMEVNAENMAALYQKHEEMQAAPMQEAPPKQKTGVVTSIMKLDDNLSNLLDDFGFIDLWV